MSARAISKVRAGERGWRYAAAILERHGAPPAPEDAAARRGWLAAWLPTLTRTFRHTGNHRYLWALDRAGMRALRAAAVRYPKQALAA